MTLCSKLNGRSHSSYSSICMPLYVSYATRLVVAFSSKKANQCEWFFFRFRPTLVRYLALSQLRICRSPPSVLIRFSWMVGSVLYSMGKIMKKISDLHFSSYNRKLRWKKNWKFWRKKKCWLRFSVATLFRLAFSQLRTCRHPTPSHQFWSLTFYGWYRTTHSL